jgi:hypothetical protein
MVFTSATETSEPRTAGVGMDLARLEGLGERTLLVGQRGDGRIAADHVVDLDMMSSESEFVRHGLSARVMGIDAPRPVQGGDCHLHVAQRHPARLSRSQM